MSDSTAKDARTRREAAQWFARLSRLSVTTDALKQFREWKKQDGHAEAYARVEAAWAASGRLAGDPDIDRLTETALDRRPPRELRRGRRGHLALTGVATAGLLALALAVAGGWYAAQWRGAYTTGVGEQRLLVLEDGSRVRLNTDSKIRVRFRRAERDVDLVRGEAFFEVAHNPARPFVVKADGANVRALGTRFDVRRDDGRVRVTLVEGQVRVTRQGSPAARILAPDQQVTSDERGLTAPAPADVASQTGWTTGRLVFHGERLDAAVAEINRYSVHKVALDGPPSLRAQRVSGVFDAGDTQAFVAAAQSLFNLRSTPGNGGTIRLTPAPAPPA